jgi:hypothetical protein
MTWGAAIFGSLASTLERPGWWVLGLASFLVRGGLLLFVLPIVILPTPAALVNAFAPTFVGFMFGSPSDGFVALVAGATVTVTAWLILGGLVAARTDIALVASAAQTRGIDVMEGPRDLAWRVLAIRLLSHGPLAMTLSWSVMRIVDAVYAEYQHPGNLAIPVAVRVAERIPEVIAILGLAWLAGEAAGGFGLRHLVLGRFNTAAAMIHGWLDLVRPSAIATVLLTGVVLAAVAVPVAAAAGWAWGRLRVVLAAGADPAVVAAALAAFVAAWLAGVWLVAIVTAWRSAACTLEVARRSVRMQRHELGVEAV